MVQVLNQGLNGNTVGAAIPLYQKGFNWLKFSLGFCLGCCLCLIFASAVTFIVLYILAHAGAIRSVNNGRMMTPNHPISLFMEQKQVLEKADFNQYKTMSNPFKSNFKYKYERLRPFHNVPA